jgi:outer membrane lipoprotein-sorting protein
LPMKRSLRWLILFSILPALASAQTPTPASRVPNAEAELKGVLEQMDESANSFRSAQADVELVQYTKLVDETSTQTGQVFFRRHGKDKDKDKDMDVALRIVTPHPKQVVITGDKLSYYDPKTGQTTERNIGNNRADVESVMNLGFGGRGQELLRDFDVRLIGWEVVDNVNTAKLELVPKSDHLRQYFTKMILWIDPKRDVPLKQQRFEASKDYQLTHYSNIKVNGKMSDDVFRLKKIGGT